VIDRYVAVLNPAKIGRGQTFFTRIWLKQQDEDTIEHFAAEVAKFPEVIECYLMMGDCDALVRIVAAGIDDYRRFQSEHLSRIKGVQNVKTDVPSQTIKQTSEMPL
ncbi:MAG: Lrp/AsnC family transcriptional regulator, partial [Mesorhizobium sp.]